MTTSPRKPIPPQSKAEFCRNMVQVTGESFFSTIGPLNVHPRVAAIGGKWGLASEWEMADTRKLIGKSTIRSYAEQLGGWNNDYFVTDSFLAAHPNLTRVRQVEVNS